MFIRSVNFFIICIKLLLRTASFCFLYFFNVYLFSFTLIYNYFLFISDFFYSISFLVDFLCICICAIFFIIILICIIVLMIIFSLPPISFTKIIVLILIVLIVMIVLIVPLVILIIVIVIFYSPFWLSVEVTRIIFSISQILTIIAIVI